MNNCIFYAFFLIVFFIKNSFLSNLTETYHGRNGPVNIEMSKFTRPFSDAYYAAGEELGYKAVDDSGPSQIGQCMSEFQI